jgi:hypothetical protein
MSMRFVEANPFSVLDNDVTFESGLTVMNGTRVMASVAGSELVMALFQSPTISAEELERDIRTLTEDIGRLKLAAEGRGPQR